METRGIRGQAETVLTGVPSLAVAAHELKAPLALMRQLSLLLRDDTEGKVLADTDVQKNLERLTLTSERSLRLVEMLTRHARLEDGLFELEPVHVGRVCEEVAHELTPLCAALGQELQVRVSRRSVLAVANHDLLRSVAFGLCDNALAYGGDKGVIELVVQQEQAGAKIRLGVRDHGPSITNDAFRKLKHRLGRAVQPIGQRPASSGLGLYVAGQFAEAMHGEIGITRHRGSGTTFYIDTPASAQLSFLPS